MATALELGFKNDIRTAMIAVAFSVQRHEDKYEKFIPDLSFAGFRADGWIEVKYLDMAERPEEFLIDHYTSGQHEWLIKRGLAGAGLCFLLVGWRQGYHLWLAPNIPEPCRRTPWTLLPRSAAHGENFTRRSDLAHSIADDLSHLVARRIRGYGRS